MGPPTFGDGRYGGIAIHIFVDIVRAAVALLSAGLFSDGWCRRSVLACRDCALGGRGFSWGCGGVGADGTLIGDFDGDAVIKSLERSAFLVGRLGAL